MKHSELSQSTEDYIEAIYLLEEQGKKAKSVEIAKMIGVSKPAVTKAMNELLKANYIEKEKYGSITLTEEGRKIGKKVYNIHVTLRDFLIQIGVSEKTAEKDCCLLEHVISKETLKAIKEFLKNKK